ncbi:MAG TPA: thiopurine S-methyltransferase [Woeseiaceae bacterium]|nr:thiopurine S-methyltransferase [Woeseiaceae bacterium]
MQEDWLGRWEEGRTGWHEPSGNAALQAYWPDLPAGTAVLVPLCGKSVDLRWLAERDLAVTGVELSRKAIEAFFSEQGLSRTMERHGTFDVYRADARPITLYRGDFFAFEAGPFDALFDRGALIALPPGERPRYAQKLRQLLRPDAFKLVVTLEYEQSRADGPPFSVLPGEMQRYWPDLERISAENAIDDSPPKFRAAGLDSVIEAVWSSAAPRGASSTSF